MTGPYSALYNNMRDAVDAFGKGDIHMVKGGETAVFFDEVDEFQQHIPNLTISYRFA